MTMRDHTRLEVWRKSTRSGGDNGNCVEVSNQGGVRDSKNRRGPALQVNLGDLLNAVKAGQISA